MTWCLGVEGQRRRAGQGRTRSSQRRSGADLVGLQYRGPFDEIPAAGKAVEAHRVVAWDEVADTEGTGIVHIAPGCGKEDFDLGEEGGAAHRHAHRRVGHLLRRLRLA